MLSFFASLIVLALFAGTIWSLRASSSRAYSFRRRLPTLYGALAGLFSLTLPWINFSLLNDLRILPPAILYNLSGALNLLSDLLGLKPLGIVAWLLDRTMWLPGNELILVMPSFHPLARAAIAAPAIVGGISLLTGLIAFLAPGRLGGKIAGGAQFLLALAAFLLLLGQLPVLDQWGVTGDFKTGLLAVSIGVGLDVGPWVALVALLVMTLGGVWTLVESAEETEAPGTF
ncbi:MAG: hypothetical protein NT169_21405 [Chloroflexi bacterium]|nr:hypothetical protein [Chloroflexota bacterium]